MKHPVVIKVSSDCSSNLNERVRTFLTLLSFVHRKQGRKKTWVHFHRNVTDGNGLRKEGVKGISKKREGIMCCSSLEQRGSWILKMKGARKNRAVDPIRSIQDVLRLALRCKKIFEFINRKRTISNNTFGISSDRCRGYIDFRKSRDQVDAFHFTILQVVFPFDCNTISLG